jgi:uncharacterized protein with GYD domain
MATYFMFGNYSAAALKGMSKKRTDIVTKLIKKLGGEVVSMYALLGKTDLVFIVKFPNTAGAMKASVAIAKATGISFTTAPAVSVKEFDDLTAGL